MKQTVWLTADTHWGHYKVIDFCHRPFSSIEEMDEVLMDNLNSLVRPDDILWHLGDISMPKPCKYLEQIRCKNKFLVKGNHCRWTDTYYKQYFKEVTWFKVFRWEGYKITMCHFPLLTWFKTAIDCHGHTHGGIKPSLNAYNHLRVDVGVDAWNYKPVSLEQIVELERSMQTSLDYHI